MKNLHSTLLFSALIALFITLAACAGMKEIPNLPDAHPETLAIGQQVNCTECHEEQQKGTMKSFATFSHSPSFVKNHRYYAATDDHLCATCHKSSFCSDCHTNQVEMKPSVRYGYRPDRIMPHRGNFMTMHRIEGKIDPASCQRCHGRANNERCIACHR